MPPTPKKGSLKVVKPTADSTVYYDKKSKDLLISSQKKGKEKNINAAYLALLDKFRQSNKGKPGYDANGFPIKKSKLGGTVKAKNKK